jgi:quinohemoprotein ethanol dehydrogenase
MPTEVRHADAFPHPAVERFGTPDQIQHGLDLIKRNCSHCHTDEISGAVPDLRRLSGATFSVFDDIVLRGARATKGMGDFSGLLTPKDTYDIRAALMNEAWTAYEASPTDVP